MRWFREGMALKSQEGNRRIRKGVFLCLPTSFDEVEVRWLEKADLVEEVKKVDVGGSSEWGYYEWRWVPIAFAESYKGPIPTEVREE